MSAAGTMLRALSMLFCYHNVVRGCLFKKFNVVLLNAGPVWDTRGLPPSSVGLGKITPVYFCYPERGCGFLVLDNESIKYVYGQMRPRHDIVLTFRFRTLQQHRIRTLHDMYVESMRGCCDCVLKRVGCGFQPSLYRHQSMGNSDKEKQNSLND
jgi:hypothetical protein